MNWNILTLSNILPQSVHEFWKYCHLSINSRGFDQSITYFCIPAISPRIEIYWYCSHGKSIHWNILTLVHMFSRFVRELEFTGVWPFTSVICPWIGVYWHLPIYSRGQSLNWNTLILANIFPQTLLELEHTYTCQYTLVVSLWIGTFGYFPIYSCSKFVNLNKMGVGHTLPCSVHKLESTDTCLYNPAVSPCIGIISHLPIYFYRPSWIWIYWHMPIYPRGKFVNLNILTLAFTWNSIGMFLTFVPKPTIN